MEYREIEAQTINEAKFKIKKEYGDNARIIKVAESSKGGFLGLGKKKFVKVLISVSDLDLVKRYKKNMGIEDKFGNSKNSPGIDTLGNGQDSLQMSAILDKLASIENEIQKRKSDNNDEIHPNLLEIKEILKQNEFFDDFIDGIVENIKEDVPYSKIDSRVEVHKYAYDKIKSHIRISEDDHLKKGKKNIFVLVGPTGVGKTTTIAKIAANAIREKLKVELITIDGYRIGAKYQLEKYAEYMRTKISGVEENLELQRIVDLSDADLILIDTIGRSANDEMNLVKMKQLLKFNRHNPEFILTVSASTKPQEVQRIFSNFDIFEYNSVIVTKLDESDTIGGVLNIALNKNKGIRYFTNGQKVPNDIEKANVLNLMDKIKGLEMEVYLTNAC